MDRRMYRGNMGSNSGRGKYRQMEPERREVCGDRRDACGERRDVCEERKMEDNCERDRRDEDFDRFPLAMCYVPWQCFRDLYENDYEALANGTLFKELDLKWYGRGCK